MTNPFPGIDPYLEAEGYWPDFHSTFINSCRDALFERLPDHYEARIDERFRIVDSAADSNREYLPDVAVLRAGPEPSSRTARAAGPLLVEPVLVPHPDPLFAEERLTWLEVRRLPDRELVTVIELLSPSNKIGDGRDSYLRKRNETMAEEVHLVELDFLLGGRRLPLAGPLPPGDFYALVTRASPRKRTCAVYAWSVRQPLPLVPVPLKAPDADVGLDLHAVFADAYRRGRYARSLRRSPTEFPLAEDDRAWVLEQAKPAPRG